MSDEELEVLVTIDEPEYGPDEDTFNHLQPGQPFPIIEDPGTSEGLE